ncbi:MAG: hypothetical protein NTY53_07995 [Kiritimatiellaeota bacterium]|nr:hypothetical protein [Kiritimatiellota bacterium]
MNPFSKPWKSLLAAALLAAPGFAAENFFACNPEGYVRHWLVAGPQAVLYEGPAKRYNDIRRSVIEPTLATAPLAGELGAAAPAGQKWRCYMPGENYFVDCSAFHHRLTKLDFYACTELRAPAAAQVAAKFWVSGAGDLWVNGAFVGRQDARHLEGFTCTLPLRAGSNQLTVRLQSLGARDTHMMFGVQLLTDTRKFSVRLPGPDPVLVAAQPAPHGVIIKGTSGKNMSWPAGSKRVELKPDDAFQVKVALTVAGQRVERPLEIAANKPAVVAAQETVAERRKRMVEQMAANLRGNGDVMQLIARRSLGQHAEKDAVMLTNTLAGIAARRDCSDFSLAGLLRLQLLGLATPEESALIKQTALGFRYWMDEPGADAMCFDSENHSLLFHGCQLLLGKLYPDEIFANSKRTGREQAALGQKRCLAWLDHVEQHGFKEFLSSTYMPLTLAALLNLVDFSGDEAIARRAAAQVDRIFRELAAQAFDGVTVGPQGRVYRNVLYPQDSGTQALLAFATPAALPASSSWIIYLATAKKYRPPAGLEQLMVQAVDRVTLHEGVELALHKTPAYLLSSLQIPRVAPVPGKVKGMQPGTPGYQQHLWHATLGRDCHVFVNHPGSSFDLCESRPGYWYGNGTLPRLGQRGGQVLEIFNIPDTHPIGFTHAYWSADAFDLQEVSGHWAFGVKGAGYIALWCSQPLTPHNAVLMGRELRAEGRRVAWACLCGDATTNGSFAAFCQSCRSQQPVFDETKLTVQLKGREALAWGK